MEERFSPEEAQDTVIEGERAAKQGEGKSHLHCTFGEPTPIYYISIHTMLLACLYPPGSPS